MDIRGGHVASNPDFVADAFDGEKLGWIDRRRDPVTAHCALVELPLYAAEFAIDLRIECVDFQRVPPRASFMMRVLAWVERTRSMEIENRKSLEPGAGRAEGAPSPSPQQGSRRVPDSGCPAKSLSWLPLAALPRGWLVRRSCRNGVQGKHNCRRHELCGGVLLARTLGELVIHSIRRERGKFKSGEMPRATAAFSHHLI